MEHRKTIPKETNNQNTRLTAMDKKNNNHHHLRDAPAMRKLFPASSSGPAPPLRTANAVRLGTKFNDETPTETHTEIPTGNTHTEAETQRHKLWREHKEIFILPVEPKKRRTGGRSWPLEGGRSLGENNRITAIARSVGRVGAPPASARASDSVALPERNPVRRGTLAPGSVSGRGRPSGRRPIRLI